MKNIQFICLFLLLPLFTNAQRYLVDFENKNSQNLFDKAEKAYVNGNYERSTKLYQQLIEIEGNNPELLFNQLTSIIYYSDSLTISQKFEELINAGFLDCYFLTANEDLKKIKLRSNFMIWQKALKRCIETEDEKVAAKKIKEPNMRKQLMWMKMEDEYSDVMAIHKVRYGGYKDISMDQMKVNRTKIYVNNFIQLLGFINEHGWPGISLVGEDGAEAAWVIAQHGNNLASKQAEILPYLEEATKNGEASPSQYAHLYDRVMANSNKPQRYGTLRWQNPNSNIWELYPLEDSTKIAEFRRVAGLPPINLEKKEEKNDKE